jgi:hypothetical protein
MLKSRGNMKLNNRKYTKIIKDKVPHKNDNLFKIKLQLIKNLIQTTLCPKLRKKNYSNNINVLN